MNLHGASPLRSEIDIVEGLHLIVAKACMEYNAFYQDVSFVVSSIDMCCRRGMLL